MGYGLFNKGNLLVSVQIVKSTLFFLPVTSLKIMPKSVLPYPLLIGDLLLHCYCLIKEILF